MKEKKPKTTTTQVMDLQHLIAGPLIATIEADSLAAQKYLDFLMKIAFESYDPLTGRTGKIRMLTFTYSSQDSGVRRDQSVSIPLMTLVPLPLLQIQEADFDFDIKILDALIENREDKFSIEKGERIRKPSLGSGFKLRASLAPKQEAASTSKTVQSLSANMKIKVKMRQSDVPAGLSNLLHLTASNIQMEDIEANDG